MDQDVTVARAELYAEEMQRDSSAAHKFAEQVMSWSLQLKGAQSTMPKPVRPLRVYTSSWEVMHQVVRRHWPAYAVMSAGWLMVAGALGADVAYRRSAMPRGFARHLGSVAMGGVGLMGVGMVG